MEMCLEESSPRNARRKQRKEERKKERNKEKKIYIFLTF